MAITTNLLAVFFYHPSFFIVIIIEFFSCSNVLFPWQLVISQLVWKCSAVQSQKAVFTYL